mmetsp:Transcript_18407/g.44306  ORF Transcript_18407/g.44306 Transcript_18407/m.44306 type:complete len:253 (-) Transcript_18407:1236-1994(-)
MVDISRQRLVGCGIDRVKAAGPLWPLNHEVLHLHQPIRRCRTCLYGNYGDEESHKYEYSQAVDRAYLLAALTLRTDLLSLLSCLCQFCGAARLGPAKNTNNSECWPCPSKSPRQISSKLLDDLGQRTTLTQTHLLDAIYLKVVGRHDDAEKHIEQDEDEERDEGIEIDRRNGWGDLHHLLIEALAEQHGKTGKDGAIERAHRRQLATEGEEAEPDEAQEDDEEHQAEPNQIAGTLSDGVDDEAIRWRYIRHE